MTATRVLDDHGELENSGVVPHSQLDQLYNSTQWVVVLSGSSAFSPPASRQLVAGSGILLTDNGPGNTLQIRVDPNIFPTGTLGKQIQWNDIPTQPVDGINTTFTLSFSPYPQSALMLFLNGVLQRQGNDSDYVLSSSTVSFVNGLVPRSGSNVTATYPW
jgi:hypothetical protein